MWVTSRFRTPARHNCRDPSGTLRLTGKAGCDRNGCWKETKVVCAIFNKSNPGNNVCWLTIRTLIRIWHILYRCVAVETDLSFPCVGLWDVVNMNSCKRNSPVRSRRTVWSFVFPPNVAQTGSRLVYFICQLRVTRLGSSRYFSEIHIFGTSNS